MKIAVVNAYMPNYQSLAALTTWGNHGPYCARHGYAQRVKVDGFFAFPTAHPVSWERLQFIRELLPDYDWIWAIGTDAMVTNFDIKLESFIDSNFHVIAPCDWCAKFQAEMFMVRNSHEGIRWLDRILSLFEKYKWHVWYDNQAILDTLGEFDGLIKFLPQRSMNSYDYATYAVHPTYRDAVSAQPNFANGIGWDGQSGQWQKGDFVIHWPGLTLEDRLILAARYAALSNL